MIVAFVPHDYPPCWPQLRAAVQERAGDRCEGQPRYPDCRVRNHQPHPDTGSRVILTTAHLAGTSKLSTDIRDLRFLCQRCHLDLDRAHHLAKAAATRARRRGQLIRDIDSIEHTGKGV